MEPSFCFICLEGLKVKTGRKRKEELMRTRTKKGESEFNLLIKYSLETRSKTYDNVFKDIQELVGNGHATNKVESKETQVKQLVRLCEKCETIGAKLLELHLELEKIQMRLINEVRSVRRAVVNSSGWLGGIGKEDGSEGFKRFSKRFCGEVISSKKQKELYKVLKAFHTAVTEIDGDSVHIPLVYLDKYKIAVPADNPNIFLGTVPDIVKTEPVDTESFQDIVEGSDTCQEVGEDESRSSVRKQFETIPSTSSALTPDKVQISPIDVIKSEFDLHLKSENDDVEEKSLKKSNRGGRRRKKRKTVRKPLLSKKKRAELRAQQPRISKPVKLLQIVSGRYHCASCDFSCKFMPRFEQHLREHETDEKKFHCDKCNVGFTNQQLYLLHQGRHKGLYNFKCDVCQTFINAFELPTHLKTHVEEVIPCPYCSFCSSSRDMHLSHLSLYHAGVNMTCDICGESFETKKLLVEHFGAIHNTPIEKLECDFVGCNKTFMTRNALRDHKNVHTDRFSCMVCHKRFPTNHGLQGHQRTHSQVPEKPLKCDQCPEAFRDADVLQAHLMRDHGAPKLECKVCGKKFLYRSILRYHMGKDHNIGSEKCKCSICNKNFAIASRLRQHMESFHSNEHNYVCEECGKAFKTSSKYVVHKQIHGEKTRKCPFCPKTFAQRRVLNKHIRIHTGVKPYACEFCGKAFIQSTSRTTHRKKCQLQPTNLTGDLTESTPANLISSANQFQY